MRNCLKTILLLITFLLFLPTLSLAGNFKVTRVYDGDTIKVARSDYATKVILVGIDAPETSKKKGEKGQPYSQQAKKYLAELILDKTVFIRGWDIDRYNRILGVVYLNRKNINLETIKAGLAEVYRGEPPKGFELGPYWHAEKVAREAKKGMWNQGDKYVSPKEWRRIKAEAKR